MQAIFRNSKHLHGKAMIPISMQDSRQEGEYLRALILSTKQHFSKYDIILTDTLYRYNLGGSILVARDLGNLWLKRNSFYLDSPVIRWDTCRADSLFNDMLQEVESLYDSDSDYRNLVNQDINAFLDRKQYHKYSLDTRSLCRDYILEETAVLLSFCRNQYDYIVYPGSLPRSINIIRKYYFGVPKQVAVSFKN